MFHSISVDSILARTTDRARFFYTHMVTMPDAFMDFESGWSCSYATQSQIAEDLGCSVTTAERAIRDLRSIAVCRVLAWPGAATETQLRVADVKISSPFGPVMRWLTEDDRIDAAIHILRREWEEIRAQSARGGS
jgi:hypothetical protein